MALEAYSGTRPLDSMPFEFGLSEFEKLQLAFERIFRFTVNVAAGSLSCSAESGAATAEESSSLQSEWEERLMRKDESANIRSIGNNDSVYLLLSCPVTSYSVSRHVTSSKSLL